ncbi:MAG: hypothetical protein CMJ18_25995 [Phycisphaeraceae bacterium]|nr:hypothetical protein [Phycisphaeraceae bacterium]
MTGRNEAPAALVIASIIVFLRIATTVEASPGALESFHWHEGFEDADPVTLTHARGAYVIHFAGPTSEHAIEGRRCYKLDVTFPGEGGGGHWGFPVRVPLEGRLRLTAKLRIDKGPESPDPGVEAFIQTVPTDQLMGEAVAYLPLQDRGTWQDVDVDLAAMPDRHVVRMAVDRGLWSATRENVGFELTRIFLRVRGRGSQRVVIYLDDVLIEGEVPNPNRYRQIAEARWAPVRARVLDQIAVWRTTIHAADRAWNAIVEPASRSSVRLKEAMRPDIDRAKHQIKRAEARGFLKENEFWPIEHDLRRLAYAAGNLGLLGEGEQPANTDAEFYEVDSTSGVQVLPETEPVPGRLARRIHVVAAAGEYEPASFVIRARRLLERVHVAATALTSERSVIPAEAVDLKWVKCWYQSEGAWTGYKRTGHGRVLIPELLLNDPDLVRVDAKGQRNHLKLRDGDGDRYVDISDPTPVYDYLNGGQMAYYAPDATELPVRDASALLPVDVAAGKNQQVWVTMHVPPNAAPGRYSGKLSVTAGGTLLHTLDLDLTVLPFQLVEPRAYYDAARRFTSSIYCEAHLVPDGIHAISSFALNETQYRATMRNLVAHGVTDPVFAQNQKLDMVIGKHWPEAHDEPAPDPHDPRLRLDLLCRALQIRREEGMTGTALYFNGLITRNPRETEALERLEQEVRRFREVFEPYGIDELYVYGLDEAHGERLRSQRPAWEAVRRAGGRIFVAGGPENFKAMGDLLDVMVWSGVPTREEAARWHGIGHRVFDYANPQVGVESPEINRRNFGFVLWRANYDGAMTWAYQSSYTQGLWNDFNCDRRASAFAMPTLDAPIDTIAWEGYREGIDDIRYGSTLLIAIEEAIADGAAEWVQVAQEARSYLESFSPYAFLPQVRARIIEYLLKLESRKVASAD